MVKTSYRKRYFEDYETIQVPRKYGHGVRVLYQYKGMWCRWYLEDRTISWLKKLFLLCLLLNCLLYAGVSIMQTPLNYSRLMGGFAIASVVAWLYEIAGLIRFLLAEEWVKERSLNEINQWIIAGGFIRALLLLIAVICGITECIYAESILWTDALAACMYLVCAFLSFSVSRTQKHLFVDISKENNHVDEPLF